MDEYTFTTEPPASVDFIRLREKANMAPRSLAAVEKGLPNTIFAVTVYHDGRAIGMGRIVGDDGAVYLISDMAVEPDHQGNGVGTRIMERLMAYLDMNAVESAYITLIADVDGFYERFGFEPVRPESKGMYKRIT